jgi:endonuclease/exonuclease/phosphatase family metal-dependent hydrolase
MKKLVFLFLMLLIVSCSESNSTKNIVTCLDNPCKDSSIPNKTVCKDLDNDFTCVCEDGYIDDNGACKKEEIDLCDSLECKTNEECKILNEEAICLCKEGFIKDGDLCIIKPNDKLKLRVMAANLTSGMYQDYEGAGMRIIEAMMPDIIMIQEFNYDMDFDNSTSDSEVNDFLTYIFGYSHGYEYYRGKEIVLEDGDIPIPNGIISKYPIIERGEWGDTNVINRNFNYAKIDIPGDKDLWVVSLHLKAGSSDDGVRAKETESLMEKIKFNIPSGDYIVIGGDLNTNDRDEKCITNLAEIFKTEGPHPVCEAGNEGTNASRRNPYDWVIASKSLSPFQVSTDFCYDDNIENCKRYENGLVFDSKKYDEYDLDVYFTPVELDDSRDSNMQHMGVIKDFELEY